MPPPRVFAALGLFIRDAFLDRDLRARLLAIMRADAGAPATVMSNHQGEMLNPAIRRAWEIALPTELHEALIARIEALRPALEAAFAMPLGASEGWSALRYPPGAFYRPHRDRSEVGKPEGLPPQEAVGASAKAEGVDPDPSSRRAVSVVVFVNDPGDPAAPYDGGSLRFYELLDDPRAVDVGLDLTPEAGMLVAFRASQLHEVTPVGAGERYSLVTWLARAG